MSTRVVQRPKEKKKCDMCNKDHTTMKPPESCSCCCGHNNDLIQLYNCTRMLCKQTDTAGFILGVLLGELGVQKLNLSNILILIAFSLVKSESEAKKLPFNGKLQ